MRPTGSVTTTTGRASASESSPSTPVRRCSSPTACSRATRTAATCCVGSSAGPSATRSARRRQARDARTRGHLDRRDARGVSRSRKNRDFILDVITREEDRFRQTLKTGLTILDKELADGTTVLPHHGVHPPRHLRLPARGHHRDHREREVEVDIEGFNTEMAQQRERAKAARKTNEADDTLVEQYRELVEQFGTTEFLGYGGVQRRRQGPRRSGRRHSRTVEIFLDRTPFYAESGGQVGDTGTITTESGRAEVLDTTFALPGLRRHVAKLTDGTISPGQAAASIDDVGERRSAATTPPPHLLHWALRKVLGGHVKQAGSMVADDRLRFRLLPLRRGQPEEIEEIERLVDGRSPTPRSALRDVKDEALAMGAMAFFGDKYGDMVRVLEAGPTAWSSVAVRTCGRPATSARSRW
ncbi:MAG: alanine--tRNA ligase-related protein [Ilumatobacteraceae bacterium]